jgi:DNA invertase Pin-like site-specific DNA recombinase
MKTAIYCRISRDASGEHLGVDRQLPPCRELVERRGWADFEVYTDNDKSAFSGKPRPHYDRMMADVRAGRVGAVVAWHADRLHRNMRELLDFIDTVEATGARVATVMAGEIDLSTASGQMHAKQMGLYSEYESKRKSERIRLKQLELAEAGKIGGRMRRYGWDGYKVVDDEAEVIRDMARRVLLGESCRSIAVDLERREVPTLTAKRGKGEVTAWAGATVATMLRRPANAGLREHKGEIIGRAQWPEILDEDTWREVCRTLDRAKANRGTVHNERTWLLSGIAICGNCGEPMGTTKKSGKYARTVYRCRGKVDPVTKKRKHCMTRQAVQLDLYVAAQVVERLSRDDARDLLLDDSSAARDASARAEALRLRKRHLLEVWDDDMSPQDLKTAVRALDEKIAEQEALAVPSVRRPVVEALVAADDVEERWESLPLSEKRAVINALVSVVVLPIKEAAFNQGFMPRFVLLVWDGQGAA